jgi:hypothetical protein
MDAFNDDIYELKLERKKGRSERCQCDVKWGTCPGPKTCPYSDYNQGEEHEQEP